MYEDKEALEYLTNLGEARIIEVEGQQYSTKELHHITQPTPAIIHATTLSGLVSYIKSGIDEKFSDLLIHIVGPNEVELLSELRSDSIREAYMICSALLPTNIVLNRFIDTEQFNIMLQSSFENNTDKELLLKVTGCIKDKLIKEIGDDGVSQAATIKTGVAAVDDVVVPNPVMLAPFRTFPEVEQPVSKFIFRMQSGPSAALYEADGGAWRNEAMESIKYYLADELQECSNVKIIS